MTRFRVQTETIGDHQIYSLTDSESGARARIFPDHGANCLELALPTSDDRKSVMIINDTPFIENLKSQPSRFGIPILFPWPSSICDDTFRFEDRTIHLTNPGEPKLRLHGFVHFRPWRVTRSTADDDSAALTCAITSAESGPVAQRFPSEYDLQCTWRLTPRGLTMEMQVTNTGQENMPFGLGLHPYFPLPLGTSGVREKCRVNGNIGQEWALQSMVKISHDSTPPIDNLLSKPDMDMNTADGFPLGDIRFNHVYQATFNASGNTSFTLTDDANDMSLTVTASKDFGAWVVFTPPDRSAISLEPWTLVPNGFNLSAAGIAGAGTRVLAPGQNWAGQVKFHCTNGPAK